MSVFLANKGVAGWKLKAAEPLRFHVTDSSAPGGYLSIEVPEGTTGAASGEITIYYAGSNREACEILARDTARLRALLGKPELFAVVRKASHYWVAVQKLTGEARLAASIGLDVAWETAPKADGRRGLLFSYIPWLTLAG